MTQTGMADRRMEEDFLQRVEQEAGQALRELLGQAKLSEGDVLAVGCSSSEVAGERIGTFSSVETAKAVFAGIYRVTQECGLFLAAQCCEHLNRALIVERERGRCQGQAHRGKRGAKAQGGRLFCMHGL